MPEIRLVVTIGLRYLYDLFCKIQYIIKCPTVELYGTDGKWQVSNTWLNETAEIVSYIKHHHAEHRDSTTHYPYRLFDLHVSLQKYIIPLELYCT